MIVEKPSLVSDLVSKHRWILIDECQDLSEEMYLFIRALGLAGMQLFLVGDEDQSIYDPLGPTYMWRLAEEFSLHFETLSTNRRSFQEHIDLANLYTGKDIKCVKGYGGDFELVTLDSKWELHDTLREYVEEDYTVLSFWKYIYPRDWGEEEVSYKTVHSFKGGESDKILLVWDPPGLEAFYKHSHSKSYVKRLINVGLTRARESLVVVLLDGYGPVNWNQGEVNCEYKRLCA